MSMGGPVIMYGGPSPDPWPDPWKQPDQGYAATTFKYVTHTIDPVIKAALDLLTAEIKALSEAVRELTAEVRKPKRRTARKAGGK